MVDEPRRSRTRVCGHCAEEFQPKYGKSKYCKPQCAAEADLARRRATYKPRRKPVEALCDFCKTTYEKTRKRQRWCSKTCARRGALAEARLGANSSTALKAGFSQKANSARQLEGMLRCLEIDEERYLDLQRKYQLPLGIYDSVKQGLQSAIAAIRGKKGDFTKDL